MEGYKNNPELSVEFKYYNKETFHWHNSIEILYVLEGEMEVTNWAANYKFKPGEFMVIGINNTHLIRPLTDGCKVMEIGISKEFCDKTIKNSEYKVIRCNSQLEMIPCNCNIDLKFIEKKILMIKDAYEKSNMQILQDEVIETLDALFRRFDYVSHGYKLKGLDKKREIRYRDIYRAYFINIKSNTILKDIAKIKGVNYHHLSKDIRNVYGQNYKKLKFTYLIENAAKILVSTKKNIIEISYECGFSDPKYFIKYFKEKYGATPNEFRNRYRKTT